MRALRLALLVLGVLVPAAGAGLLPAQTTLVHFRAFDAQGRVVGLRVGAAVHGSCFFGSAGLPRPDAWRCTVGNEIYDPCLESPKGPHAPLICVSGTRGIPLHVLGPLPVTLANHPEQQFFAWRLVLSNGDVCERLTGTSAGIVQGQGLDYGCTSGGVATEPSRAKALWTVRYLAKGIDPRKVQRLSAMHLLHVSTALG